MLRAHSFAASPSPTRGVTRLIAAHDAALGQRNADLRTRRQRRRDARHDLVAHAGRLERGDFLLRAAEEHRIAALEPHDDRMHGRRIDQPLVDELLRRRVLAAALADGDLAARSRRARSYPDAPAHRGTRCRRARAAARRAASAGRARPGLRRPDRQPRSLAIIPAATVLCVASSIRMKLPVARLSS